MPGFSFQLMSLCGQTHLEARGQETSNDETQVCQSPRAEEDRGRGTVEATRRVFVVCLGKGLKI